MSDQNTLTKAELAQFTGTEKWYRHPLARNMLYTDGVKYMAEAGGAYWLIDEIALNQMEKSLAGVEFQFWKLQRIEGNAAVLTCNDGDDMIVFEKHIPFTDFPLEDICLYMTNNVIHLPSEH